MLKVTVDYDYLSHSYDLTMYHNEKIVERHSDWMKLEDVGFIRDLKWIKPAIEKAYQLGVEDGKVKDDKYWEPPWEN